MPEKPIFFSGLMVRALLDGKKTMTRRVIKQQPFYVNGAWQIYHKSYTEQNWCYDDDDLDEYLPSIAPYQPGDLLFVKEGHRVWWYGKDNARYPITGEYIADGKRFDANLTEHEYRLLHARKYPFRATPSRFMYRSLSRIILRITSVRAERLQEITEEDARAEGIPTWKEGSALPTCREGFAELWDSINGKKYPWESNPLVWVYGLEVVL